MLVNIAKLASAIAVIAPLVSALPTAGSDVMDLKVGDRTVQVKRGVVRPGMQKRSDIPAECQFVDGPASDFTYYQVQNLPSGDTACFGYSNEPICSSTMWGAPDNSDITESLGSLVTMSGQTASSSMGSWDATFFLGTTAFSNRDISEFTAYIADTSLPAAITYYWSRDENFASVLGYSGSCP